MSLFDTVIAVVIEVEKNSLMKNTFSRGLKLKLKCLVTMFFILLSTGEITLKDSLIYFLKYCRFNYHNNKT